MSDNAIQGTCRAYLDQCGIWRVVVYLPQWLSMTLMGPSKVWVEGGSCSGQDLKETGTVSLAFVPDAEYRRKRLEEVYWRHLGIPNPNPEPTTEEPAP